MAAARRRGAQALAVLRRALADGSLAGQVEDVARWLEEFHPHAIVELDYGGLVHLLTDDELRGDDSPDELTAALRVLADGDADAASAACDRVVERWRRVRALEAAN
jgi:DNA-binding GntR family transcriptional regulator